MKKPKLSDYKITQVPTREFRNQRIQGVDFAGQHLEHLRFFDCVLTKCSFDGAVCQDLRMWSTTVRDSTFRNTDLRDSALGGVLEGRVNSFEGVDFSGADMRRTAHGPAVFIDCLFDHTNLNKVDFQGSRFIRCRFRGKLSEVMFYDHGFRGEAFEANRLDGVDFSDAELRWVAFRRLDLEKVALPSDENHIVIRNYPAFLDYALNELEPSSSIPDRVLTALFQDSKKWLPPGRSTGMLNRLDFFEGDESGKILARLDQLLTGISR